jgi:hypothetical protein
MYFSSIGQPTQMRRLLVFITELNICLWESFMPTVADVKVLPMWTVGVSEFI